MSKKTLIYIDGNAVATSLQLVAVCNQLNHDSTIYALCLNLDQNNLRLVQTAVDHVLHITDQRIQAHDATNITTIIEEMYTKHKFCGMLFLAEQYSTAIAARTAMALETGLTADVTQIKENELIRPAFDGKILAGIVNKDDATPLMATIRPNIWQYTPAETTTQGTAKPMAQVTNLSATNFAQPKITLIGTQPKQHTGDIRESRVLVSGGGGIEKNFASLNDLADLLNAQVSASRKIVDAGNASRNIQVGQSGKTVSPKLYIAIGIHGTSHHMAGLKNIEHIVSVNTNKQAPICSMSDIVVEDDASAFIQNFIGYHNTYLQSKGD